MQNKHQFFLVLGVLNYDEGGGSTCLGQNPKFFEKLDLKAPLTYVQPPVADLALQVNPIW